MSNLDELESLYLYVSSKWDFGGLLVVGITHMKTEKWTKKKGKIADWVVKNTSHILDTCVPKRMSFIRFSFIFFISLPLIDLIYLYLTPSHRPHLSLSHSLHPYFFLASISLFPYLKYYCLLLISSFSLFTHLLSFILHLFLFPPNFIISLSPYLSLSLPPSVVFLSLSLLNPHFLYR